MENAGNVGVNFTPATTCAHYLFIRLRPSGPRFAAKEMGALNLTGHGVKSVMFRAPVRGSLLRGNFEGLGVP